MIKEAELTIDDAAEELRRQWRRVYTEKDLCDLFGGPKPTYNFNKEATLDTIRHFAHSIGDENPLYSDEDYAGKTRYRDLIAPPSFLFSVWYTNGTIGALKGYPIHTWNAGNQWEWFKIIGKGDRISYKVISPTEVEIRPSQLAGRILRIASEAEYFNQRGETIAVARGWSIRAEARKALDRGKYANLKVHHYTPEEARSIRADQDNEVIRGATPRYWEDVVVGEGLRPVVMGPFTPFEWLVCKIGCGNYMTRSDRFLRSMNTMSFFDDEIGIQVNGDMPHFDSSYARKVGMPAAYDSGHQRASWLIRALTNWMGDDGFLWKVRSEMRAVNIVGDTTWCKGKVVKKFRDGAKCCVDIECSGENQRQQVTMPGTATVILPSREGGPAVPPEPRHID